MTELTQVYATDAEDGVPPSFELIEASDYWEVPIEGHGPPENPVPGMSLQTRRPQQLWML